MNGALYCSGSLRLQVLGQGHTHDRCKTEHSGHFFPGSRTLNSLTKWGLFWIKACQGDEEVRRKIDSLLAAHVAAGKFMNGTGSAEVPTSLLTIGEGRGTVIGPYKLMEQIGEGGFGVVYVAQQEKPISRKSRAEDHQTGDGYERRNRPLRGRTTGAGADGSPQYGEGVGCRSDRVGTAVLRHGTSLRSSHHRIL